MRIFIALTVLLLHGMLHAQLSVGHTRLENLENPLGLDVKVPRFSWQVQSDRRNTLQTHHEIRVAQDESFKSVLWTTGKNMSDQSQYVAYGGPALASNQRYFWQVRVWDNFGRVSTWSPAQHWHTGLFAPTDWTASWIAPAKRNGYASPYLHTTFRLDKKIKSAVVFATAHGMYELYINGQKIGKDYFTPGWTAYHKRIQYQCYDVTDVVQKGLGSIGAILANGWFLGELGWENHRDLYGTELALLAQLHVTYTDGSTQTIATDNTWQSGEGAVRFSEIYDGEQVDYRLEPRNWHKAGGPGPGVLTGAVAVRDFSKEVLVGTYNEPVRATKKMAPQKVFEAPNGLKTLDFGQNLVGVLEIKAQGTPGTRIILRYAEVLDPKTGNPYFDNLRHAHSCDTFYLAGTGVETCAARFTFHGFRYATYEVTGGTLQGALQFTAIALHSDMEQIGQFSCDHPLLNQLQHNIEWGQRGNFLDVPTDCPQRDERLGWTGDAQAFSNTAHYNFDAHNFFVKWLKDLAADQKADGRVPYVIPHVLSENAAASTGWADAATIIPWNTYVATGDRRVLEEQYESMKAWVGYMEANAKDHLWNTGFHFGDWLFFLVDNDCDGRSAVTDKYYIAQCFFAHSVEIMVKTAQVLDKKADVERYLSLLKNVKQAFVQEYVTANGRPLSSTQTAYVLALQFDMLPESQRAKAAQALADNVKSYGSHLTTGFLGTPYLCHVLSRFGYAEVAYDLLLQETYPSWLYPVRMGATTIWERWDGIKPDSTFQNVGMNSFNHYAYGAIGDWMYRHIGGIQSVAAYPGYKQVRIAPRPSARMSGAKASLSTPYGVVKTDWRIVGDSIFVQTEVPPNAQATVELPTGFPSSVRVNGVPMATSKELLSTPNQSEAGTVKINIGSGAWSFVALASLPAYPQPLVELMGKYRTGGNVVGRSEIKFFGGKLQWVSEKLGTLELAPDARDKDLFRSGAYSVRFKRSGIGTVNMLEIGLEDGKMVKGWKEY
jgi:alpha-L-rhamnosidase